MRIARRLVVVVRRSGSTQRFNIAPRTYKRGENERKKIFRKIRTLSSIQNSPSTSIFSPTSAFSGSSSSSPAANMAESSSSSSNVCRIRRSTSSSPIAV
uniref:Uncharacterized protein n=1 Tax=Romanomermis culicivorax TaxID=13658 RepID=A0A915LAI9_ROMCU